MDASQPLLQAVRRHLDADPRPLASRCLVVAVSGGADSVALLRALHAVAPGRSIELVVAHLDHGLRGAASMDDAAFVASLAAALELPARLGHAEVAAEAAARHLSLEDAARRARRRFLAQVAADTGATRIALGHTRDDQAETLLLNLLRGAGPRGLAAMPQHGPGAITRPLLHVPRADAHAYLEALGQPWREDASNADPAFARNRVRHELLPRLLEFNPAIVATLAGQAELFAEIDALLTRQAEEWLAAHLRAPRAGDTKLRFPVAPLAAAPRPLRAAIWRAAAGRLATGSLDWSRDHFEALDRLIHAPEDGGIHLPAGVRARREGAWLYLLPADTARSGTVPPGDEPGPFTPAPLPEGQEPLPLPLSTGAEIAWGPGRIRVTLYPPLAAAPLSCAIRPPDGRRAAFFALDALAEAIPPDRALRVRPPRTGDRMAPFGCSGHRPVSHLLAEAGVPAARRAQVPLVVGEKDEILWIPGVRRSGRAPMGPATTGILALEWFGPLPWEQDDD